MYERNAIVLERYMEQLLELDKTYNLRENSENYQELVQEIENYQMMTEQERNIIQEFDKDANRIEKLQQEQDQIYRDNKKLEDDRAQYFMDLGEDPQVLEAKLKKTEEEIDRNNEALKEIREQFIEQLFHFSTRQKDRNQCEKNKRVSEANHIEYLKKMHEYFGAIDVKDIITLKDFIAAEKDQIKKEALEMLIRNGKNERIPFHQEVLKKAIKARIDIAEKEAECFIVVYEKMKKLLAEIDSEDIKLNKYKKTYRDMSVKLAFLRAEKEYIVGFLDNERMAIISGTSEHKRRMIEACNNFELDMMQIRKLYELILKEINTKATKKAYNELYNKTYLRNIEDKEKNFEKEMNNVNISMGTVINSNYWRIEGIKNIYTVFQEEISSKFGRDLSDYRVEEDLSEEDEDIDIYDIDIYDETGKQKQEEYETYENEEFYETDELEEQEKGFDLGLEEDDSMEDEPIMKFLDDKNREEDMGEENIESIIEKSRRKGKIAARDKRENKGLLNKLFKK